MLRIISGKHRNRRLDTTKDNAVRPTMARAREAIFNILTHGGFRGEDGNTVLDGAVVLDLFAGSGALGIEALSRGARHVIFIDINQKHLDVVRRNLEHVGESDNATLIRSDSSAPPPARFRCNVIFLDPPYDSDMIAKSLKSLVNGNWLEDRAVVVIERGKGEHELPLPKGFTLIDERHYGKSAITILLWNSAAKGQPEEPSVQSPSDSDSD
ncbi:MAG: rsmD [Rickettsiales bacterium]|jgi:16S rRNA (guanine966-N2)-methyltransferase|nr:rsmD [Rickettsiales bacterium]